LEVRFFGQFYVQLHALALASSFCTTGTGEVSVAGLASDAFDFQALFIRWKSAVKGDKKIAARAIPTQANNAKKYGINSMPGTEP
jgi:hypothetical protein